MYYSKANHSVKIGWTTRQTNQDVIENPYYGEVSPATGANNEKETNLQSQSHFTAITKVDNMYYE